MTIANALHRLRTRAPGSGLGRDFYTDPKLYEADLNHIFYREWLFAAHGCELPATGSYVTLQVGAYPLVLVRAADGLVRAFVNACRHRGSRLCAASHGTAVKLVCPYHQWTYALDGRLLAARQMGPNFDRERLGLKQVHCESVGGYIFVCLSETPPAFAPARTQLQNYLAPHRLSDARVAYESTIVEEGNWKLVWENNRECYHCAVNHPELGRVYPDTPTVTSVSGADSDPQVAAHWRQCDERRAAGQLRSVRGRADPHRAHAAARECGELHQRWQRRGPPAAEHYHSRRGQYRRTAAVPLSLKLEPRAGGSRDLVPGAAIGTCAHAADDEVAGAPRGGRGRRL